MFQPVSGKWLNPWKTARRLAQVSLVLLASFAFAAPEVVDPNTEFALDFTVKDASTCVLLPERLYDPKVCDAIPRKDSSDVLDKGRNLHALAVLQKDQATVILTVSSMTQMGLGQMYEPQIRGFLDEMMSRLTENFGTKPRFANPSEPYSVQRINGVPVVHWEYTTDLPETDQRAGVASGVAWMVPSKDTVHIVSFNTQADHMAAARELGAQVSSSIRVPLTVDADRFGGGTAAVVVEVLGEFIPHLLILGLLIGAMVWLWRRGRK